MPLSTISPHRLQHMACWPAALVVALALTGCDRRPSPEVPAPPRTDSSPVPDTAPVTPPSQPASPASAV